MDFCRIPLSLRCKIVWNMNRISLLCKRPFIWLARFRHRCGYGVHSPFAFHLITGVIYEKTPYYKYAVLQEEEKRLAPERPKGWRSEPLRVKRLLFLRALPEGGQGRGDLYRCYGLRRVVSGGGRSRRFPLSSRLASSPVCGGGVSLVCDADAWLFGVCHRGHPLHSVHAQVMEGDEAGRTLRHHVRPLRPGHYLL